jgi:hypothetical protein
LSESGTRGGGYVDDRRRAAHSGKRRSNEGIGGLQKMIARQGAARVSQMLHVFLH